MVKIILVSLLVLISSCSKKSGKKGSMRNSPNQEQEILIKIDNVVANSNSILIYTKEILDLDSVEFYTDDKCLNQLVSKNKDELESGFQLPLVELNKATNIYAITKKNSKVLNKCSFIFTFQHDDIPSKDIPEKFGNNLHSLNGIESKDGIISIGKGHLDDFGELSDTKYIIFYSDENKTQELVRISLEDYIKQDFTFTSPESLMNTSYNIYISFADSAGNISQAFDTNVTIRYDTLGPLAPTPEQDLLSLSNSITNNSNDKTISFKPSEDVNRVEIYTNGLNSIPLTYNNINSSEIMSVGISTLTNQVNEIIIRSYDKAGNYTDSNYTYIHDNIAPLNESLNVLTNNITFNSSESTLIKITGILDGTPYFFKDSSCVDEVVQNSTSLSDGVLETKLSAANINDEGELYWQIQDSANNKSSCILLMSYTYDITAPNLSFDSSVIVMTQNGTKDTTVSIKGLMDEDGFINVLNYSSNPSGTISREKFQQGFSITLKTNKVNNIDLKITDNFGNEKNQTISITHDSIAPVFTITSELKVYTFDTQYFISGTANESGTYILKSQNIILKNGDLSELNSGFYINNNDSCISNPDYIGVKNCTLLIEVYDTLQNKRNISITYFQYIDTSVKIYNVTYDSNNTIYDESLNQNNILLESIISPTLGNTTLQIQQFDDLYSFITIPTSPNYAYNSPLFKNTYINNTLVINTPVYNKINGSAASHMCSNSNGTDCSFEKLINDNNFVLSTTLVENDLISGTLPEVTITDTNVKINFEKTDVIIKNMKNLVGQTTNIKYLGTVNEKAILAMSNPNSDNSSSCSLVSFDILQNKYSIFPSTNADNTTLNCSSDINSIYFEGHIYFSLIVGNAKNKLFKTNGTTLTQITNLNGKNSDQISFTKNQYLIIDDTLFFIASKDNERLLYSLQNNALKNEMLSVNPSSGNRKMELVFALNNDILGFDSSDKTLIKRTTTGNSIIISNAFENIYDVLVLNHSPLENHNGIIVGTLKNKTEKELFALNKKYDETFTLKSILSFPIGTIIEEAIASNNKNHVLIKTSLYRDYLDKNVSILYGVDLRSYLNSGSQQNYSIFTYTKEFQIDLNSGFKQICPFGDDKFVTFSQDDFSFKIIPMITNSTFSSLVPISNISESEDEKLYSCQSIGVNKTIFTSTLNGTNTGLYIIDDKMQIHQLQKFNSPEVSITDYKDFGGDEFWFNLSTDELLRYKINE